MASSCFNKATFTITGKKRDGRSILRLNEELIYTFIDDRGYTNQLTLPQGFEFDGASIPNVAIILTILLPFVDRIDPIGQHWKAAAFHDYIWWYKGLLPYGFHMAKIGDTYVDAAFDEQGKPRWTFKTSNKLFARHLRESGIGKATRRAMYAAVNNWFAKRGWKAGDLPTDARRGVFQRS